MVRVKNLENSLHFYVDILELVEIRRKENKRGKYTLVFLGTDKLNECLELTYHWNNGGSYSVGRNFGHLSFTVENIYGFCEKLLKNGVKLIRPPKDGHIAFFKSPDSIPIEIVQEGKSLPAQEPWLSMTNDPQEMPSVQR